MPQWFFTAANLAAEKLNDLYDNHELQYQVINSDRVVEHWICAKNGETSEVLVTFIRSSADKISVIIYTLTPIASVKINQQ